METNFCQLKRQNNFEDDDKTQKPTNKWNQVKIKLCTYEEVITLLQLWRKVTFSLILTELANSKIGWIWWDGLLINNWIADNQTLI
jgi:hypothetical protein